MGALLDRFITAGVTLEPTGDGNLRALGPLTDELRAAIRANKPVILAELAVAANDAPDRVAQHADPDMERRRAKALALLTANPLWSRVVVAEVGDPVVVGIAIRGVGYRELEIPVERYDVLALIALLDKYGVSPTVH